MGFPQVNKSAIVQVTDIPKEKVWMPPWSATIISTLFGRRATQQRKAHSVTLIRKIHYMHCIALSVALRRIMVSCIVCK